MYSYLVHPVANNAKKTAIIALWHDKNRLFVEVWKIEVNPVNTELPPPKWLVVRKLRFIILFFSLLAGSASGAAETWVDSCFYCSNGCRRASFSLSMQSNAPTKLRIFFGISSLFPSFLIGRGQGRVFCVCFMNVRFVARGREGEVGFDGFCCCKLLTQSDLYKIYWGLSCV